MMSREDELDQQSERYIQNRMSDAERIAFEQQMQDQPLLKKEVEELLSLKNDFDTDLFLFKKKLTAAKDEWKAEQGVEETTAPVVHLADNSTAKKAWVWSIAAASLILLIGIFYFYNSKPRYEQLAMNAALHDFPQTRSGAADELDSLFDAGSYQLFISKAGLLIKDSVSPERKAALTADMMRAYILMHKPLEATRVFTASPGEIKSDCTVRYAAALAWLERKEKEKVLEALDSIIKDKCYPLAVEASDLKKCLE